MGEAESWQVTAQEGIKVLRADSGWKEFLDSAVRLAMTVPPRTRLEYLRDVLSERWHNDVITWMFATLATKPFDPDLPSGIRSDYGEEVAALELRHQLYFRMLNQGVSAKQTPESLEQFGFERVPGSDVVMSVTMERGDGTTFALRCDESDVAFLTRRAADLLRAFVEAGGQISNDTAPDVTRSLDVALSSLRSGAAGEKREE